MEIERIKEIFDLVENSNFEEVELEEAEFKIRVKKKSAQHAHYTEPVMKAIDQRDNDEIAYDENSIVVKSPLVGTFYRAPSPDSEPFVKPGDYIKSGQVLCIVEAMKLMNEIESETDGFIRSILLDNAQPVEYGEPLFVIEKN
ncbi:MAG: acetyl-CoA carboxylase biotin carboxyl carrier protein [bacterium]